MSHSRRTFLETLIAGCAMSGGVPMAQAAAKPSPNIFAGGRRQLLFDDYLVGMGGPKLEDYPFNIRLGARQVREIHPQQHTRGRPALGERYGLALCSSRWRQVPALVQRLEQIGAGPVRLLRRIR